MQSLSKSKGSRHKILSKSVSSLAIGAAFGLIFMAATPSMAAETTSSLRGRVASAPAGTKVTATNIAGGGPVSVNVRADGTYDIVGLRPGSYQVVFRTPDGKVLTNDVVLSIGETSELNGDIATAGQEVVVTGRRRNVRSGEVSTNVTQAQISILPQNGRNFLNFAALAPGVMLSTDPENKQFRSGALSANAVNLFIDGVSQKNQVLQGGVAGQDSSRGNPFPQGAIQEYKVSTQNFSAEYEQASSAIITAITKTGGNDFHGEIFGTYQSKSMIGQPFYDRANPKGDFENKEYGIVLNGPIIRDRLFYLFTYEGRQDARPGSQVAMPNAMAFSTGPTDTVGNPALAASLAAYNGLFPKDFQQDTYFGKLTFMLDDANTFDLTLRNREEADERDFGGSTARTHGSTLDQYIRDVGLHWKYRGDNFVNEAAVDWQSAHWRQSPLGGSNGPAITFVDPKDIFRNLAQIGSPSYTQEKAQEHLTFRNTFTRTGIEWRGRHVVKVGAKLALYDYIATEADHFNPEFFYNGKTYVPGGTNTPLRVRIADGNPEFKSDNTQVGLFITDDWTINEHWTVNVGIRWDYESNMLNNDFVTPTGVAAAMRAHVGFNKVFNANDFISTGSNREAFKGAFQPRLNFSYDVNGDRNTVLFGGYGRYYDRTIYDNAQLETRRAQIHIAEINFAPGGTTPWNPSYFNNPQQLVTLAAALGLKGEVFALNNETKVPYSDQFNLGIRQRFGEIQTSATLSHTQAHDTFSFILGNRTNPSAPGVTPVEPGGRSCGNLAGDGRYMCRPWGDGLPGYGNLIINVNEQQARSTSLYLTAEKPYTKASGYGWTMKLDLNNAEQTGWTDRFVFDWGSPSDTGWHDADNVPKWNFYGTFIKDLPWEMQVAGTLAMNSGFPQEQLDVGIPLERHILGAYYPEEEIAYKQFDIKLSKDFTLPNGNTVTLSGQAVNAFDWVNKTYSVWGDGGGGLNAPWHAATYKADKKTTGPARSYQLGLVYRW